MTSARHFIVIWVGRINMFEREHAAELVRSIASIPVMSRVAGRFGPAKHEPPLGLGVGADPITIAGVLVGMFEGEEMAQFVRQCLRR